MTILLTGGSGFIGSYVLKRLLATGNNVNVLAREPSRLSKSIRNDIKIFAGDINDYDTVTRSVKGCDIVIHLAALVRSSVKNPSDYFHTNINGTANLLKAARLFNLKKFVFTSSLSAHSYFNGDLVSEESLLEPESYFSRYGESKAQAEKLVIEQAKSGTGYIIIYPTRVFGIGPLTDSNAATKAVSLYLQNRLPFLIESGTQYSNWAFVEDVADGIVKAALSSLSNEKFILGGENKTLRDVYDLADNILEKKHLRINLKMNSALKLASLLELISKLSGKQPLITKEWLKFVMESQKISCGKAAEMLNYKITPFYNAMEKTMNWLNSPAKIKR